jgi:hypothetical protein
MSNKRERMPASLKHWHVGFAMAVASIGRCGPDASMMRTVMEDHGVTLDDLRRAGAKECDIDEIARAYEDDSHD